MSALLLYGVACAAATLGYFLGHRLGDRRGYIAGVRIGRLLQMSRKEANSRPSDPLGGRELAAYREAVARKAWQQ